MGVVLLLEVATFAFEQISAIDTSGAPGLFLLWFKNKDMYIHTLIDEGGNSRGFFSPEFNPETYYVH